MKTNYYLICLHAGSSLALALAGCSDGGPAVAGPGKLTSIDQRPSLANPLNAAQGTAKRAARRPGTPPKALR